jgi:methyl-accepting chemotaxis protein
MKLRTKLILLVTATSLLFLLSVGAYFAILSPLDEMQKELSSFQELSRAAADVQVNANLLVIKPFSTQGAVFQTSLERFHAAQEAMKRVTLLASINEEVAKAVKATAALGELSEGGLNNVANDLADIKDVAQKNKINYQSTDWSQMMRSAAGNEIANGGAAVYTLSNLSSELASLNESLTVTRQVVEQKDKDINAEIDALKVRSTLSGLAIILLAVGLSVVLSFFLARNIAQAMSTLGRTISKVGAGDLRVRFHSKRQDELGGLGRDLDGLLDALTESFRRIQAASNANLVVKDLLVESVSSATSSAVQIEANSASILEQLRRVDERIQASEADLKGVVELLEAFHARLDAQGQSVGSASRDVNDLAQGIARISELSDQNRRAVEALLAESDRGREVFDHSFAKVAEINDSVSAIQDLVGAIADIAGQTNILALNAAIEAAHAGEAGRGFAVVADEISKLAAASAASSAQIANTIKDVVGKIREAGATRAETLGAFDAIGTHIATVSDRSQGIDAEVSQMNQGTHRIREVMEGVASGSDATTRESDHIGTVATKLGEALGQVGRISHEVVSNIGEITAGLAEISRTVNDVSTQAEKIGHLGEDLDEAVHAFQTEVDAVEVAQPAEDATPVEEAIPV